MANFNEFSKTRQNGPFFALSTQNVNVARFALNIEWDFFGGFQILWLCYHLEKCMNRRWEKLLCWKIGLINQKNPLVSKCPVSFSVNKRHQWDREDWGVGFTFQ